MKDLKKTLLNFHTFYWAIAFWFLGILFAPTFHLSWFPVLMVSIYIVDLIGVKCLSKRGQESYAFLWLVAFIICLSTNVNFAQFLIWPSFVNRIMRPHMDKLDEEVDKNEK